ncbi:MAG: hypothetical protein V8Q54_09280 [Alistipes senegalensis]
MSRSNGRKKADGWHVSDVAVKGKRFPNPKGYYTILYLNRNPAAGLVDQDLEGKAFTFYPSDAERLADGSLRFSQKLRFGRSRPFGASIRLSLRMSKWI